MSLALAGVAVMALSAAPSAADRTREVWDLSDLYPTPEAWAAGRSRVAAELPKIDAFRGRLGEGARPLRELMDLVTGLEKEIARLGVYAGLKADEDLRDAAAGERQQVLQQLSVELGRATSFINPELLALGNDRVLSYLAQEPAFAPYRFTIGDILRQRPHILGAEAEKVLSTSRLIGSSASNIYGILTNADIPWPTVKFGDGSEVRLDAAGYTKYRAGPNRDDRRRVFDAFWAAYKTYERTFGSTLAAKVNADLFYARSRNFSSTLAAALERNAIPESVYRALLSEVNASLPTLHRYFRLRGRMLGVDQPHYYDIYPPMVELQKIFPVTQARQLTLAAVAPLGPDYVAKLTAGFAARWMHTYPQTGKRSGAYMNGSAYDVHPYLLLNYNDDYESVSTIAHEWGHAMHSRLADAAQPYPDAGYTIFTAEIASVVNEVLLLEHMLKAAQTDDEKLYYLGSALENMRGTFYRQTMFAEFELAIHEVVEKGGALSGDRLTRIYADLLKRYHGHAQGVLVIDDLYTREWAYIPHFYRGYYVYQYATSMAAANAFADRILAREPGAVDTYLSVLKAGGSKYPYQLVKEAGVDLATAAPYQSVARRMNMIMDRMEAILAQRKKG
ncbi:MAG: oligoendopeptidase F [Opitutaceae bacterium]|nr:oligoendopeptidase F [Opitutaceae bacterium]